MELNLKDNEFYTLQQLVDMQAFPQISQKWQAYQQFILRQSGIGNSMKRYGRRYTNCLYKGSDIAKFVSKLKYEKPL